MNVTVGAITDVAPAEDPGERCELLGSFALFVQGALGALALLVLIWKRSREHPQRPLMIWFMDVLKQVIGGVLVHIANLLLSMLSSGTFSTNPTPTSKDSRDGGDGGDEDDQYHSNPCSFYLLNLGIDTTLGVVILIYVLRGLHRLVEYCPIPGLRTGVTSGYYGDPPRWTYWTKQASIYFSGLMVMKFMVWIIFALFPWLGKVGDFLLSWTEGNRQLQIFFVMFFFPLVMNAFQYYVIDSFIKHKDPTQTMLRDIAPTDDEEDSRHSRRSFNYEEVSDSEDGSKGLLYPGRPTQNSAKKQTGENLEGYDPDYDGTNSESRTSPQSGYFRDGGDWKKPPTIASQKSRNSSMMLLPGSRGPSTPGYADDEQSTGGSGVGRRTLGGDDDSTLVGGDSDQ